MTTFNQITNMKAIITITGQIGGKYLHQAQSVHLT